MSLGDIEIRCTKQARTRILDIDEDDANDRIHVTKHSGGPEAASRISERWELTGLTAETRKGEGKMVEMETVTG
jgi:hypothetical protein